MNKRNKNKKSRPSTPSYNNLFAVYCCTVGLFIIGWAFSEARVWGFNWWAYQPTIIQAMLVIIAGSAGPLLWLWSKNISNKVDIDTSSSNLNLKYWILITFTLFSFIGLFSAFTSTTHFLGDGYYLLTSLTDEVGFLKSWDIGATLINDMVFNTLGEPSQENVLLTFRIISIGSGFLMLFMLAFLSYKLFEHFMDRSLFFFGMICGGYTLQFFGYVENYALFVVMVMAFTLLGLLAALGRISRWWAIIPAVFASGLHIFGVTLFPALLYILFFDKKPLLQISRMSIKNKSLFIITMGIIAIAIYFFLFYKYYFFRFAFLPLVPDRFTVDNDFLLSPKHLWDFFNLLVMLVPGVGIFVFEILKSSQKKLWNGPDKRFLLLLLASTIACIYLFNPGHGMPRNWDLFSLPSIPLSVLIFYILISSKQSSRRRFLSASLAITLGFLILIPRVSSQRVPDIAIKHFKNYVELDPTRNRNARSFLTEYYRTKGDEEAAIRWNNLAVESFPEAGLTNRGKQLLQSGNYDQAESMFLRALQINPIFVDAYSNLGTCYINRGDLKKAMEYLEIGDGLNPLNPSIINNKGTVFLRQKKYQRAEDQFLEVLRIDRTHVSAIAGLVSVYVQIKDDLLASEYLEMGRNSSEMPVEYFQQGVGVCIEAGLMNSARLAFDIAVERGANPTWQQELFSKYPTLQR